ncbi:hypothetical protein [Streptomyces sp. NPDC006309]|uniref:hypothetical protein n=1 Tax=Streptomyces sp. NPDC006309 TaxID=3156749 RepID=UPI0033A15FB5
MTSAMVFDRREFRAACSSLAHLRDVLSELIQAQISALSYDRRSRRIPRLSYFRRKVTAALENVRGISARGLRPALLPEGLVRLKVGLDADLRVLLLEQRGAVVDLLDPLLDAYQA